MPTLEFLRKQKALTQAELAELCGVAEQTVWYWENGKTYPRASHIRKLAQVLGKEIPEILQALEESRERPAA